MLQCLKIPTDSQNPNEGKSFPVPNAHTCSHADSQGSQAPNTLGAYATDTRLNLGKALTLASAEVTALFLCYLLVSIHPWAEWMLVLHASSSRKAGGGSSS